MRGGLYVQAVATGRGFVQAITTTGCGFVALEVEEEGDGGREIA